MGGQEKNTFTAEAINPAAADSLYLQKYMFAEDVRGGPESWLAMGNIVMNRLKSGKFGKDIQSVVKKASSAVATNSPEWQKADKLNFTEEESKIFNQIQAIAEGIVGGQAPDNTKGATHFENLEAFPMPWWAKNMDAVTKVGKQTYFKEKAAQVKPNVRSGEGGFGDAFRKARQSGVGEFDWQGSKYNTKVRGE